MPRPSAQNVMTDEQMDEMNSIVVQNRLYDRETKPSDKVSIIIESVGTTINDIPTKVRLQDTDSIKKICWRYICSCQRKGVIPTKIGFARALGHSRQSLDYWCASHSESESAQFLQVAFDAFGEILASSALAGGCNEIVAMFLMKSLYHIRENDEVPEVRSSPLGEPIDEDELEARILAKYYEYLPEE